MTSDDRQQENIQTIHHLLLLMGGNPLPNLIAAELLAAPGADITLITTPGTRKIGDRLRDYLQTRPDGWRIHSVEVRESEPVDIVQSVQSTLDRRATAAPLIGLHYTGGTKTMAVHAYRAVEQWLSGRGIVRSHFSYLNPRALELVVESSPGIADGIRRYPVGLAVRPGLRELMKLHGWDLVGDQIDQGTITEAGREVAQVLSTVYARKDTRKAWENWLYDRFDLEVRQSGWAVERHALKRAMSLLESIRNGEDHGDPSADIEQAVKAIKAQLPKGGRFGTPLGRLKTTEQLARTVVPWPEASVLSDPVRRLSRILGRRARLPLSQAAHTLGLTDAKGFCEWIDGKWLETVVLEGLRQCQEEMELHDICCNLKPRLLDERDRQREDFEFDVIALRGYQLFACSCTTESHKGQAKLKLFEANIRARQLGGDEARVGLVCTVEDPEALQRDIQNDIGQRVMVFGAEHLPDLGRHLKEWIIQQSLGSRK